jgi:hypothetical protein
LASALNTQRFYFIRYTSTVIASVGITAVVDWLHRTFSSDFWTSTDSLGVQGLQTTDYRLYRGPGEVLRLLYIEDLRLTELIMLHSNLYSNQFITMLRIQSLPYSCDFNSYLYFRPALANFLCSVGVMCEKWTAA